MRHLFFLVPGFFGFTSLGEVSYWGHVAAFCKEYLSQKGLAGEVICVQTLPTASIRDRAARLLDEMTRAVEASEGEASLHLIGHSTGGLDARLLLTPAVSLRFAREPEPVLRRVRSLVTVATPHYGAPLAGIFSSLLGQQILQALSLATIYSMRFGSLPLSGLFRLAGLLTSLDDRLGIRRTIVRQLVEQLLADFTEDRQRQLRDFFEAVEVDRALLFQLSSESMDLFEASVCDRPGVRYGAVVTRAQPPGVGSTLRLGLDPYAQAIHALYHALHRLAGSLPQGASPPLEAQQREVLLNAYGGQLPTAEDNDGIIPTRSQARGRLIQAVSADHLDVLGHFEDRGHEPPHFDWIVSASGFTRAQFESLWAQILEDSLGATDPG